MIVHSRWGGHSGRSEALAGYLFIAPTYLGYLVFIVGPIVAVIALSLTKYDLFSQPILAGPDNFVRLFKDPRLLVVYRNTMLFTVLSVGLNLVLGLGLAVLLNRQLPTLVRQILRSAYFFPSLIAAVYVSLIWQFLYQRDTGAINYYLAQFGVEPINWISSAQYALVSVIILDVWKNVGFSMLVFLAGLQNIPTDYYDAARVDGAGSWRLFRSITLPLISPTLFFLVVVNSIASLQVFDSPTVLTKGGPGDASRSLVMYIYEKAFKTFDFGYASAVSISLLVLVVLLTFVQFRLSHTWVEYE